MINGGTGDFWEYSLLGVLDAVGFGNSNKDDWIDDGEMRLFLLLQNVPIIGFKGKPGNLCFFRHVPCPSLFFPFLKRFPGCCPRGGRCDRCTSTFGGDL